MSANGTIEWLTAKQVMAKIGFSRANLYKKINLGIFPSPVKIGYASRWVLSEVEDWMRQQTQRT